MGWMVNATARPLYPREGSGTRFVGGWDGQRAGLGEFGKFRPHRDAIYGPSTRSE
jgi:hypothetical protein